MNEIILKDADILNDDFSFESKIGVATNVATTLKRVLHDQNLVVKIKKNEYVLAEGWNTLGTILGTYAKTVEVVPFESLNGKRGYKARVCIMKGESQLACAEAIDVPQKDRNGNLLRDEAAMYSMAQTRAMGKAYRMAFSWIVKMAGFNPTPAEEMENVPRSVDRKGKVIEEEIFSTEYFEKVIYDYCERLHNKQLLVTKARVISYINKSADLSDENKKLFKEYVRNNWRIEE